MSKDRAQELCEQGQSSGAVRARRTELRSCVSKNRAQELCEQRGQSSGAV